MNTVKVILKATVKYNKKEYFAEFFQLKVFLLEFIYE